MSKIFICYRQKDSGGHAGRLYDRLVERFGKNRVYMDIDSIPPGADFVEHIKKNLNGCAAVVVLIGHQWFSGENRARLTDSGDHVRQEIAQALASKAKVFPVLVHGGKMPSEFELPRDIQALARRNAIEIRDSSFNTDFEKLARNLHSLKGLAPIKAGTSASTPRKQAGRKKSGGSAEGTRTTPGRKGRSGRSATSDPAKQETTRESGKTGTKSTGGRTRGASTADTSKRPRSAAPGPGPKVPAESTTKSGRTRAPKAEEKPAPESRRKRTRVPQSGPAAGKTKSKSKPKGASGGTGGGGARSPKGGGTAAGRGSRNSGRRGGARGPRSQRG
jgi:hypothetical protein